MVFILFPIHPILLHLRLQYITLKLTKDPRNSDLILQSDDFKYHLAHHKRLELGLETIFQLSAQLILFLNTISQTRTSEGLVEVFKEKELALLELSVMWSFISCCISHLGVLSAYREFFPLPSKIIAGLHAVFAVIKRVLSIIFYVTPPLGLFSLLRHLQVSSVSISLIY